MVSMSAGADEGLQGTSLFVVQSNPYFMRRGHGASSEWGQEEVVWLRHFSCNELLEHPRAWTGSAAYLRRARGVAPVQLQEVFSGIFLRAIGTISDEVAVAKWC
jgi:hypothetical protein